MLAAPVSRPALQGIGELSRAAVPTAGANAPSAPDAVAGATAPSSALDALLASLPAQLPNGSAVREPGLQTRVGALQQGADYLDRLGQQVQGLRQQLSQSLANGGSDAGALQASIDQVDKLWQARSTDAGGLLDAQLQPPATSGPAADAPAQQRFQVRGLDAASLQKDGAEVLRLRVPGQGAPVRAQIDGGSASQGAKALRDALAPAGVQVQAQSGTLWFSVDQSRWPAVRDGLTVQGDGKRFPSGQAVRPALQTAPDAVDTRQWRVGSTDEQRATLRSVTQAQGRIAAARKGYSAALDQAATASSSSDATTDATQAADLGQNLAGSLRQADFSQVAALSPALRGLHRDRVRQLLSSNG